jgi:hypothetical protein
VILSESACDESRAGPRIVQVRYLGYLMSLKQEPAYEIGPNYLRLSIWFAFG